MAGYADAYRRASAMRSFYEPAFFGGPGKYDDPLGTSEFSSLAGPAPTTMGGFEYQPRLTDEQLMAPYYGDGSAYDAASSILRFGQPSEFLTRQQAAQSTAQTAQNRAVALEPPRPTYGMAQLQNYGIGALQNYGLGALQRRR